MAIVLNYYSDVTCDSCGLSFDELNTKPKEEMRSLLLDGWKGTYRKCYCPECSKRLLQTSKVQSQRKDK